MMIKNTIIIITLYTNIVLISMFIDKISDKKKKNLNFEIRFRIHFHYVNKTFHVIITILWLVHVLIERY